MKPFDLVILDEPTAAMDMEATVLAETLLKDYCRETGCAVLFVTHSLSQARRLADTAMFLQKGCLLETGSAATVLAAPRQPETQRFLQFYGI